MDGDLEFCLSDIEVYFVQDARRQTRGSSGCRSGRHHIPRWPNQRLAYATSTPMDTPKSVLFIRLLDDTHESARRLVSSMVKH